MQRLIVVAGPTCSGKTAKSIEIAKEVGGEIICGDSMQIYRHMRIGTASPTEEEKAGITHHLFNFLSPLERFSVSEYVRMAHRVISEIAGRGVVPILVGGTGLYLDSVANNRIYAEIEVSDEVRQRVSEMGNEELMGMLSEVDAESAAVIKLGDRRRLQRAIEIYLATGKTKTERDRESHGKKIYEVERHIMDMPRDELYERINARVDVMMEQGLLDEVRALREMGVQRGMTAGQAIGYKELFGYLDGEATLEEAIAAIKQATRRYAKRQLTWLAKDKR